MTDSIVKVKKTGYRAKKTNNAGKEKVHVVKRTLADFPAPRRIDDGKHFVDDSVKLVKTIYKSGGEHGLEGEFPLALAGDYGKYQGDHWIPSGKGLTPVRHCAIKLLKGTAYLLDDGYWFEWI